VTYLLDNNVLSETRKRQPVAGVKDFELAGVQVFNPFTSSSARGGLR
jgi:hypothetical protein